MFIQLAHLLRTILKIARICLFCVYLFVVLWLLFVTSVVYITIALRINSSSGRKGNNPCYHRAPPPITLRRIESRDSDTMLSRESALCERVPRSLPFQQPRFTDSEYISTANTAMEYSQNPITTVATLEQEQPQETPWQKYDIPQELRSVVNGAPQEICTIVRDSTHHFQAIKASLEEHITESQINTEESTASMGDPVPSIINPTAQHTRTESNGSATTQKSSDMESQFGVNKPSIDILTIDPPLATAPVVSPANTRFPCPRSPYDDEFTPTPAVPSTDISRQPRKHRFTKIFRRKVANEKEAKTIVEPEKVMDHQVLVTDVVNIECISCFDETPKEDMVALACQHQYCSPCFSKLVSTATENENLFPPKCCLQEVPQKTIKAFLSRSEYDQFKAKAQEFTVPAGDRWFCPSAQCGKWFDKSTRPLGRDVVSCPFCRTKICQSCQGLSHVRGRGCPQDRGLDATIETAELNGWRRCYNCHAMVERDKGCQHITCRCKAEFCYICGTRWKTCRCSYLDENRRERELRQKRAVFEAENTEVRAAIAAVETVIRRERQRQEREERQLWEASEIAERLRLENAAKEAQTIEKIEATRLGTICHHFVGVGCAMSKMHDLQHRAMLDRHQKENNQVPSLEEIRSREKDVELEVGMAHRASVLRETERISKTLHLNFARHVIDATARHREELDKQFEMLNTALDDTADNEIHKGALIGELMDVQQTELKTLRAQLSREIEKLRWRVAEHRVTDVLLQKQESIRLEKASARQVALECTNRHQAELCWWDITVRERQAMLEEDKQRLIDSGADFSSFS